MLLLSAQYKLSKARSAERVRLDAILTRQESTIRKAFTNFLREARSDNLMRQARQLLEVNNIQGAMALVDQHVVGLGRVIPQAFVNAASTEASALGTKGLTASRVALGFDPSDAQAAQIMRTTQLQFVQQVTNQQRDAIRAALANAYAEGASTQQAAAAFKDSIGLTRYQVEMVENYRRLLETGSAEALNRQLRDRRYDPTVERSLDEGEPLEADQINRMVERYRANLLSQRASTIARTEGLGVTSLARQEALRQVVAQAGFDPADVKRRWNATKDKRTRDSHAEMDGQLVGLEEPFVTPDGDQLMYPGDPSAPAKERINCRCTVTTVFG